MISILDCMIGIQQATCKLTNLAAPLGRICHSGRLGKPLCSGQGNSQGYQSPTWCKAVQHFLQNHPCSYPCKASVSISTVKHAVWYFLCEDKLDSIEIAKQRKTNYCSQYHSDDRSILTTALQVVLQDVNSSAHHNYKYTTVQSLLA